MFLTDDDYAVVIGEEALKVISRASDLNRENAEREAVEEISGYLRPVYDCKAVFDAAGTDRNSLIVMRTADIALYHLVASLPQKMGIEIRKERYDRAIEWLEDVQAGKIVPDLPRMEDSELNADSSAGAFGVVYNSERRLRHNW